MKKLILQVMMTTVGLVACAPLEQAPLVYSSKNQIGVGVSAGTPDSPGLDITIGYKGLDAAYVPVAVSKPCPKTGNCGTGYSNIEIIAGNNNVAGQKSIDKSRMQSLERAIDDLNKKILLNAAKISNLKQAQSKQVERDALQNASAMIGVEAINPELQTARIAEIDKQIAKLTEGTKGDINALLSEIEETFSIDRTSLAVTQEELRELTNRLNSLSRDDKKDALSVYGSFDGAAGGSSNSANISLGKVFSTGIAAQNLTQGIRNSAEIAQRSLCLEKLNDTAKILAEADRAKLLSDAVAFCSGSAKEQAANP